MFQGMERRQIDAHPESVKTLPQMIMVGPQNASKVRKPIKRNGLPCKTFRDENLMCTASSGTVRDFPSILKLEETPFRKRHHLNDSCTRDAQ